VAAWGEIVRTLERLGRALLRVFADARRRRGRVPVRVTPGPPPHWVERVREGAPGLLESPARERVQPTTPAPAVRRAVTATQLQQSFERLRQAVPRRASPPHLAEPIRRPPPPAAEPSLPGTQVGQAPPPDPGPPPPAAFIERSDPPKRPAGSTAAAVPARPLRAVVPLRRVEMPPPPAARAVSWGLSPEVPAHPQETRQSDTSRDVSWDRSWTPLPRPRLVTVPPRPHAAATFVQPLAERAALARLELAVAARASAPAIAGAPVPRPAPAPVPDPWPDLPPQPVHHDADPDATLRALARARRLDDEQGRL
jgi:hypothetical protein